MGTAASTDMFWRSHGVVGKLGGEEGANWVCELQGWSGNSCAREGGRTAVRMAIQAPSRVCKMCFGWMEELEGCWKGSGGMKADKGCCVYGVMVFPPS